MKATNAQQTNKLIGTREWYNFIALVADLGLSIHAGGEAATQRLLNMLQLDASDHVLDVGCGSGETALHIGQEIGARVTGIDVSEEMVAKAKGHARQEGLNDKLHFQVGDVFNLDFADATFDAAVFESVLTIIPGSPEDALSEIVRVLRPGGRIGGNEATLESTIPPDYAALIAQHPAIQRTFTPDTLRAQFEAAGLHQIEMHIVPVSEAPSLDMSKAFRKLGLRGIFNFFIRTYPKLVQKLLFDARFRKAHRIDEQITKLSKQYMGYALIVGQK